MKIPFHQTEVLYLSNRKRRPDFAVLLSNQSWNNLDKVDHKYWMKSITMRSYIYPIKKNTNK